MTGGLGAGAVRDPHAPAELPRTPHRWLLSWLRQHEGVWVTTASLLTGLLLWDLLDRAAVLGPAVFAGPGEVADALWRLVTTGELFGAARATGMVLFAGFVLAAVAGVLIGLILGSNAELEALLRPYLMAGYAMPRVAFISLLLIWLGFGPTTGIVLVFTGALFPIAINTLAGARGVDRRLLRVARSLGANRWKTFLTIVLPYSVPHIVSGMQLGIGRAIIGVFVAEMFGAREGIGYLIIRAGLEYDPATLLGGILVLAIFSLGMIEGIGWLGRLFPSGRRGTA